MEPVIAGYLIAWGVRKARLLGGHADGQFDQAMLAVWNRLTEKLLHRVGADPAVAQMQVETANGDVTPETRRRLEALLGHELDGDPRFREELAGLLRQLPEQPPTGTTTGPVNINATSHGQSHMFVQGSGTQTFNLGGPSRS